MADSNKVSKSRYQFRESLSQKELEAIAADPEVKVLQTNEPASLATWELLNEVFFSRRPDVELRIYGCYSTNCDLRFTTVLTNVRRFAADCLQHATGVEHLGRIPNLEALSVGIFDLESFDFLNDVSDDLRELALGATRSRKPGLAMLPRFGQLREIYLESQQKRIDALSQLRCLEKVTLRSISTASLEYLKPLDKLWSLDLKLGGIRELSAIRGMENIKYFEAWQVRGLSDLSVVEELPGLQNLFLQSLPRVRLLPPLSSALALRRVVLMNMSGLRDFTPLASAPALEEFSLIEGTRNDPKDLIPVLRNPRLVRAEAFFGSVRKNHRFEKMLNEAGLKPFNGRTPFHYSPAQPN